MKAKACTFELWEEKEPKEANPAYKPDAPSYAPREPEFIHHWQKHSGYIHAFTVETEESWSYACAICEESNTGQLYTVSIDRVKINPTTAHKRNEVTV